MHTFLADVLVLFHAGFVIFVVGGLILIVTGAFLRWSWVRNLRFRVIHLLLMMIVAAEAIFGLTCPLTTWEYELRRAAGQETEQSISFVGRLAHDILFLDVPESVFPILHIGFGLLVILAFVMAPPRLGRTDRKA